MQGEDGMRGGRVGGGGRGGGGVEKREPASPIPGPDSKVRALDGSNINITPSFNGSVKNLPYDGSRGV